MFPAETYVEPGLARGLRLLPTILRVLKDLMRFSEPRKPQLQSQISDAGFHTYLLATATAADPWILAAGSTPELT